MNWKEYCEWDKKWIMKKIKNSNHINRETETSIINSLRMIRENNNDTPKKWADREREPYGHEKTVYSFSERLREGERDF